MDQVYFFKVSCKSFCTVNIVRVLQYHNVTPKNIRVKRLKHNQHMYSNYDKKFHKQYSLFFAVSQAEEIKNRLNQSSLKNQSKL